MFGKQIATFQNLYVGCYPEIEILCFPETGIWMAQNDQNLKLMTLSL